MRLLATSDLHLSHRANREALDDARRLSGRLADRRRRRRRAARASRARARARWRRDSRGSSGRPAITISGARPTRPTARAARRATTSSSRSAASFGVAHAGRSVSRSGRASRTRSSCRCSCSSTTASGPPDVPLEGAVAWARESGVVCGDEQHARSARRGRRARRGATRACAATEARLDALPAGRAHGARQSLAASLRPRAAAARAALLDLVRHDAHRRLGAPLSRARRRLRPPAPAHDALAARRALRRSLARLSARLARRARHRLVPARDPAGARRRSRSGSCRRAIRFVDRAIDASRRSAA